jgi:hypothetical protein
VGSASQGKGAGYAQVLIELSLVESRVEGARVRWREGLGTGRDWQVGHHRQER